MAKLNNSPTALVVGAGPVGLTMAFELARRGISLRLIDRAPQPSDKSKAIALHARTMEILENMGLVDQMLASGHRAYGTNFYANGKRLVHLSFDEMDSPYPFALMLPQCDTERLLRENLSKFNIEVERPVELVSFEQDAEGVTAQLRLADGSMEQMRTDWLLGCDGAHSAVRHTLQLPFEGEQYHETFATADLHVDWNFSTDELSIFVAEDGMLAFFPLGDSRFRIIADSIDPHPTGDDLSFEELKEMVARRAPAGIKLENPVWLTWFTIHRRSVSNYRKGRAFLAGDAAHIHSPALGQGMNTGMHDAHNLAWKLALVAKGEAKAELLDSYNAERHPIGQALLRTTDMVTKAVTIRNPIAQAVRARLIPLLAGHEVIQQRLRKIGGMLSVNYRHSPIVDESRSAHQQLSSEDGQTTTLTRIKSWLDFAHGPAPGDHALDNRLFDCATNSERRLFQILQGTKHNLLLFSGLTAPQAHFAEIQRIGAAIEQRYAAVIDLHYVLSAEENPPLFQAASVLLDSDESLHHRYGSAGSSLYLVRPDGYIGFRSQPAELASLEDFLKKLLV